MNPPPPFRATIQSDWIDYNGHLRDAYYVVLLSQAVDELMDHWGLGTAYRETTRCTLYTLELHMHFLHEIKSSDALEIATSILDFDPKRIHAVCDFFCSRLEGPAATGEVMLLHVHQGHKVSSAPLPTELQQQLAVIKLSDSALAARKFGSRKIELKRR